MANNHDNHDCSDYTINDLLIAAQRERNEATMDIFYTAYMKLWVHVIRANLNTAF